MEENHRSRKRRHTREHGSGHVDSRKHHKHYKHQSASPRHDRFHSPKRPAEQRPPLAIKDQNELSADRGYVTNWLAQIQNEDGVDTPKQLNTGMASGRPQKSSGYLSYDHTAHRPVESRKATDSRPKSHEEHASSDSSLLEASKMPVVDEQSRIPQRSNAANHGHVEDTSRSHNHQRNAPSTITSISSRFSVVQPKKKCLRKERAIRQERIEGAVDRPIRPRREKRGDRKRAAKKASQDLMSNFASNKIGQNRLTVRPSNGPGIFQNGRASSPPIRRGLPDLAFSEMEFLQRSGKKSQINDPIVVPKSRAKENKKAARAQDEIAEFFKPSKTPIRNHSPTIDHLTSPTSIFEVSLYERQLRKDREDDRYRYYTEDLAARIDEKRTHLMDSNNQQVQPNDVQFSEKPTPKLHSEEISSRKVLSKTTGTIVTWSESQYSPGATTASRRAREQCCQRQMSATPDSIRNSIELTGIFKDTGIESSVRRKSNIQELVNEEVHRAGGKDIISTIGSLVETSREFSSLGTDSAINSYEIGRSPSFQQPECLPQLLPHMQKNKEEPLSKESKPVAVGVRDKGLRRIVGEYYDPDRGWYRGEESEPPPKSPEHHSKQTTVLTATPLTRQQMASNAKIRRPSTTLPVIREASDESREKSLSSMSIISRKGIQRTESAPVQPSGEEGDMSRNTSPTNDRERLANVIVEPQVSEQTNSQFQHDQQIRSSRRGEIPSDIGINPISLVDEEGEQTHEVRTANPNSRIFTPLKTASHIKPSSDHLQLSTQSLPRGEHESYHGLSRHHFSSTLRSPQIRVPSLYVHQMELEQEKDQITNGLSNEKLEEYGFYEGQEPHFGMEAYEENWDDLETEQGMSYGVEDVLESRRYMGNLRELGPQEANMYQDSMSRYEMAGLRYDIDLRTNDYQYQDVRGAEYNPWGSDNHFVQEPWVENRQDLQQQHEIEDHGDQLVRPSFPSYRELDEGHDGNASETILMQRFWRPNPQY
ncbi:uncharacterized protein EAF01_009222 [Botrytis porri]|uniref:uncharacterized protein n=1 Tax=Botrytis porri TaxID=87229 RepID=UPI0018FFC83C|nr:uncharacterized protein EAF01_009222 [Botrytis porri]KAF7896819.1 hypothetical protein EAF01_009222 [Botrytis porri]